MLKIGFFIVAIITALGLPVLAGAQTLPITAEPSWIPLTPNELRSFIATPLSGINKSGHPYTTVYHPDGRVTSNFLIERARGDTQESDTGTWTMNTVGLVCPVMIAWPQPGCWGIAYQRTGNEVEYRYSGAAGKLFGRVYPGAVPYQGTMWYRP
jgi:hypothetical protein